MSQPKKSTWNLPSFDCPPSKTPAKLKRNASMPIKSPDSPPKRSLTRKYSEEFLIKKENISSLALLMKACYPNSSSDLAISRQKQQEISSWIESKTSRGKSCILIISGPSGCGKTAAIRVIAKEYNFDITEWITPLDQLMDENNRVMRQGDKFEEFLIRATRYNSVLSNNSRRLLLIKELPNVFLDDKEGFHAVLERYTEYGREPLVFINTETGNSRIMQTVFGANVREKFGIDLINIYATTQVAMKKTLERISKILNGKASHFLNVTQEKINETLANNIGDVRSAVLNLVFASLKVPDSVTKSTCEVREETLTLLHGIGRVINPKRINEGNSTKFFHNPDDIAAFFQSQAANFVHFLHENYLNTMRDIERAELSSDILSAADVLTSEWRDLNLNKVSLSFCVRGLMVANNNPVCGWNPVKKPQNAFLKTDRNLASAEISWYKSLIDQNLKKSNEGEMENAVVDEETIIEDVD
ncbi:cell cycle checkpoint protein RAD17 [Leptopilina heterotoma]|uniref:cell cycle checkpoint protein RAD17 n=1 Tax=Leptopilina heterotoma TaxID=63436 RepID=UPI001CA91E20|nr:cell cycle checkpoint protein RAD17 [Leptopilina heterotoma]